jgi:hypothetical protein
MATRAHRDMRRPLLVVLALLLMLGAGAKAPQTGPDHAARSATASSAARTSDAPAHSPTTAEAASVGATHSYVAADRERVLRTQLVIAVRAARAPPFTNL